jgi:hypothetical protein
MRFALLLVTPILLLAQAAGIPAVEGPVQTGPALRYIDLQQGTGDAAAPGKRYTTHYTGYLRDGTVFDSSVKRNEPIDFVQGRRQVIAGWDIGFEGMKVGGKRRLIIPPQLAYGAAGSGPIPPNSELTFDIELLKVEDAPNVPPAVDLLTALSDLEKKYLALAKALPEEKLGWRPDPGARSFYEVLVHAAHGNALLLEVADGKLTPADIKRRAEANAKLEKATGTKATVIKKLEDSFAEILKTLEPLRAGSLSREGTFFGATNTVRGVFVILETHAAEHLGQLIAYFRFNGMTPPWSQPGAN